MVNTEMPKSVQRIYNPLWQDVALLHAKRQLADAWFWDREALEVLRWGAGPAILAVRDSVSHDLVLSIQRLLDPALQSGHENLSLERLVQEVEVVRQDDEDLDLRSTLVQLRNRHKTLEMWRNKRSGHRDLQTALIDNPMPGLTADSIGTAISDIGQFMNRVLRIFENAETHWEHWFVPEAEQLILRLRRAGFAATP